MSVEFGVRKQWKSGRSFVAAGFTEDGARAHLELCSRPGWDPRPVEVVYREAGEWQPLPTLRGEQ